MKASRLEPVLFGLFMSMAVSLVMAGFVTAVNTGLTAGFVPRWLRAFLFTWPIAFVCVAAFVKPVRGLVQRVLSALQPPSPAPAWAPPCDAPTPPAPSVRTPTRRPV